MAINFVRSQCYMRDLSEGAVIYVSTSILHCHFDSFLLVNACLQLRCLTRENLSESVFAKLSKQITVSGVGGIHICGNRRRRVQRAHKGTGPKHCVTVLCLGDVFMNCFPSVSLLILLCIV